MFLGLELRGKQILGLHIFNMVIIELEILVKFECEFCEFCQAWSAATEYGAFSIIHRHNIFFGFS